MKKTLLILSMLLAAVTFGSFSVYAQITNGKPIHRAFIGKTQAGNKTGGNKTGSSSVSNQPSKPSSNAASAASKFTDDQVSKANTAKDASYLTAEEKNVIFYCNLARLDGQVFVNQYLSKMKNSSNSYEQSLLKDLAGVKNLPMLKPNSKLARAAKVHTDDIGPKGLTQHESSDGTDAFDRVRKYYNGGCMGENISFGYSAAMDIVLQLLVDDGVASLGHRKNILSKDFLRIGVSIGTHKEYGNCCVQDFSDESGDSDNNSNSGKVDNGGQHSNNGGYHNNNNNGYHNNNNGGYHNNGHRPNGNNNNHNHHYYDDDDDDDDDDYGYDDDDDDDDYYYDDDDDDSYYYSDDYYDDDDYCDDDDDYYDDDF
jgi:uncharacterized protein YkwD